MRPCFGFISFVVLLTCVSSCSNDDVYQIKTEVRTVHSAKTIQALSDSLVQPIIYTNLTGFEKLPFKEAKERFISAILPAILIAKQEMETRKKKIERLKDREIWTSADSALYQDAQVRFSGKNLDDILSKMGTLPNSVVLAQAAVETGWGQSRFFINGNNLFGVWSMKAGESRMVAGKSRKDKKVFVRSYNDLSESVSHYLEVLARANAYRDLRKARERTSNPFQLVKHLKNYSEQGSLYTQKLEKIIRQNKLTKYDHYRLHPSALIAE